MKHSSAALVAIAISFPFSALAQSLGANPMQGAGAAPAMQGAPVLHGSAELPQNTSSLDHIGAGQPRPTGPSALGGGNAQNQVLPPPPPTLNLPEMAIEQVAPMSAAEIRRLREVLDEREGAARTPLQPNAIPTVITSDVDLSPGAVPQVVRITPGQGALVNIIDSAGNPWPIKLAKNFNDLAMRVEVMGDNTLSITALSHHLMGSVGVLLHGMSSAWQFTVIPAQGRTDYRVDLRMPGLAPNQTLPVGGVNSVPGIGQDLSGFLFGGTPEGARRLEVHGLPDARAWQDAEGRLVLRTKALVSAPGWYQRSPASDGTAVYQLPATPIVTVSLNGELRPVRIAGLLPVGTP